MKTIKNISLSILMLSLFIATGCSNDELAKQQKAKADAELAAMQHERDSVQAVFEVTLADINNSLTSIFDKKNTDKGTTKKYANKEEVLKNIQLADDAIQKNKKRISSLKSQLSKYKIDNASLNKQIEEASIKLQQFETQLANLQEQVNNKDIQLAELNRQAENLKLENVMQKEFADKFETDLNTAYYTTGSHKELVKTGVLDSKGGILGIGSTEVLKDNFPDQMFAKIDIRKTTSIPVNAKKAKLITNHPESSYEFKENNGLIASLEIKDPTAFWKTSKHMVLEVR
jgi:hypothetical protein